MKASSREDVVHKEYLDGLPLRTEVLRNRAIYKNAAGVEYISWVKGRRAITRENGRAIWHHYTKTIRALNIPDLMKKVKETGGAVVVLGW